jgi:phenylpropionate dioxygenase-like ring-hydroxylating dioxygenase large terminal subunit
VEELANTHRALRRAWHPLCRSEEVTATPRGWRLLGEPWVAWRDASGVARVFLDRCPHRLAPLTLGQREGEGLRCGYHGWVFDETGLCTEIPALGGAAVLPPRARLSAPAGVHESHGMLFVAPDEPLTPRPRVAAAEDPDFMVGELPLMRTRGGAALLADNFLDVAHFPFVHAATFGADEAREVPPYAVTREGFTFRAVYEHDFANREDPAVARGERPLVQRRRLTYRYTAPFHLELDIEFLDAGGSNVIGFFLCPEDDETVRIYSTLWRNDLDSDETRMKEAVDFEVAVVEEDLALQSRFHVLSMPLDVTAEVHTRADRTTLEMRRILADLVAAAS